MLGLLLAVVVFCLAACGIPDADPSSASQDRSAADADTALDSESHGEAKTGAVPPTPQDIAVGTQVQRGFLNDNTLHGLYTEQGLTEEEIDEILVLDVKGQEYFTQRGYTDQHAGGQAFAHDETVMGWLFSQ